MVIGARKSEHIYLLHNEMAAVYNADNRLGIPWPTNLVFVRIPVMLHTFYTLHMCAKCQLALC